MPITLKDTWEIDIMAQAGKIVKKILDEIAAEVRPGKSTSYYDQIAMKVTKAGGGIATFKGYRARGDIPFPGAICASVNSQVVHAIPSEKVILKEGDLFKVDVGVTYKGYVADAARTFPVGTISEEAKRLVACTQLCLENAIQKVSPGAKLAAVCGAVEATAKAQGFSVVRDYVGHGVGKALHEEPQVPNYVDPTSQAHNITLMPGLVIAIEPMVNVGGSEVYVEDDGWTIVTADGKLSAHFEDSVAVMKTGRLILTR